MNQCGNVEAWKEERFGAVCGLCLVPGNVDQHDNKESRIS